MEIRVNFYTYSSRPTFDHFQDIKCMSKNSHPLGFSPSKKNERSIWSKYREHKDMLYLLLIISKWYPCSPRILDKMLKKITKKHLLIWSKYCTHNDIQDRSFTISKWYPWSPHILDKNHTEKKANALIQIRSN